MGVSRFFQGLLDSTQAVAGFVVDYYKFESMAFVHACATRGVPSVDLQHGIQGPYHMAYGRWSVVPDEGYELLPRYFWVWSEDEARHIDDWRPARNHEPVVGGNPFLRMLLRNPGPRARAAIRMADSLSAAGEDGHTVLVTLHGYETPDELDELARIVSDAPARWRWWIRAHPGNRDGAREAADALARNGVENAETEIASAAPLFALLPRVDVHVTVCSSVVIDAAAFGVPSVVIGPDGAARYANEHRAGLVELAPPAEMVRAIERMATGSRRKVPLIEDGGIAWAQELLDLGKSRA
ncbi:MAG: hypothetical protein M3394_00235 [Actinomycetota bacterium]|nr:hypothetical protein [Actinomycetota bacterium]